MYGTVARLRVKPGMESKLEQQTEEFEGLDVAGYVDTIVYRMDANPNEFYMVVIFEDKDSYMANADSPEQDARYREFLELLEGEPEWHDGEIVYMRG